MTTVVTLSVLVYMIIEMHVLWRMKDSFCYQYRLTNTICTTVGLFSVYFVLWYRLHTVFYLNPILQQTTSKLVFILNKLTVVLLVCMTAINIVTFLCSPHYVTTPFGCVNVHKTEEALLKWFLLLSSTAFFQALLFFSLVYPLRRHRQEMLNCGVRPIFLKPIVKRAIIVACICLISDALNVVYALTNQEKTIYIAHVVYGTNMLINMLALLMSFTDWKQRLFPWNFASIATASPRPNLTLWEIKSAWTSLLWLFLDVNFC